VNTGLLGPVHYWWLLVHSLSSKLITHTSCKALPKDMNLSSWIHKVGVWGVHSIVNYLTSLAALTRIILFLEMMKILRFFLNNFF
jgi:hypothetical protein